MSAVAKAEPPTGQPGRVDGPAVVQGDALVGLRSATGAALIAATVLASAVGTLDANVIKVAVPAIGRGLHANVSALQWTLTGYLLTVAALLLLTGALADRFGRRRVLVVGLLVMLGSAILCSVAPSVDVLIGARIGQGVGGALVVPSSLALLNGTLRASDRARGIGIWAGLEALATTVGPYAGGWLVGHVSWRAVFLLNVPLILAGLLMLRRVPESDKARGALSFDSFGGLLAVIGLGGLIYALTAGPASGWTSAPVLASVIVGLVSLAALVPVERRRRAPMLRLSLFASRQFDAINVTTVLLYGALSAASYLVFLQLELRLGYSPAQAGAALIPESAVFLVIAPLSGALVSHVGPRWLMVSGILMVAGAFVWLSAAHPGASYAQAILPGALLWGLGIGLTVTPLTAAVLAAASDVDLGEASGVNDASSRVGGVIVIALVPVLIGAGAGRSFTHSLANGFQPTMIVMGVICVVAALIAAVFVTDGHPHGPRVVPHAGDHSCGFPIPDPATP
ncbi:MAG TPA: DHA2 family efflux MFS transporter permease subunit [Solirubrobacteraceae bacterium]|jgi:EmrB/QacA subfamily drug resistance transporter